MVVVEVASPDEMDEEVVKPPNPLVVLDSLDVEALHVVLVLDPLVVLAPCELEVVLVGKSALLERPVLVLVLLVGAPAIEEPVLALVLELLSVVFVARAGLLKVDSVLVELRTEEEVEVVQFTWL